MINPIIIIKHKVELCHLHPILPALKVFPLVEPIACKDLFPLTLHLNTGKFIPFIAQRETTYKYTEILNTSRGGKNRKDLQITVSVEAHSNLIKVLFLVLVMVKKAHVGQRGFF